MLTENEVANLRVRYNLYGAQAAAAKRRWAEHKAEGNRFGAEAALSTWRGYSLRLAWVSQKLTEWELSKR